MTERHLCSPFVHCYPIDTSSCEADLEQVKADNGIEQFQLAVLCGSEGVRSICAEPSMLRAIESEIAQKLAARPYNLVSPE